MSPPIGNRGWPEPIGNRVKKDIDTLVTLPFNFRFSLSMKVLSCFLSFSKEGICTKNISMRTKEKSRNQSSLISIGHERFKMGVHYVGRNANGPHGDNCAGDLDCG